MQTDKVTNTLLLASAFQAYRKQMVESLMLMAGAYDWHNKAYFLSAAAEEGKSSFWEWLGWESKPAELPDIIFTGPESGPVPREPHTLDRKPPKQGPRRPGDWVEPSYVEGMLNKANLAQLKVVNKPPPKLGKAAWVKNKPPPKGGKVYHPVGATTGKG